MVKIIGANRLSLFGDCVLSLPFSTYLKKKYPNSLNIVYIDQKCAQIIPFLLNHPKIDGFRISEESDKFSAADQDYFKTFDLAFYPFPQLTRSDFYNHWNQAEEIFLMSTLMDGRRIDPKEYNTLTEEEKYPRLTKWFKTEKQDKTKIAIWPKSGYADGQASIDLRSPSIKWWEELVVDLNKLGYEILLFGHPKSDYIKGAIDRRNLSLFDAVKETLSTFCSIGTDSGSQHIIGALGFPQIILYTNYSPNHFQNFTATLPLNWAGNLHGIFGVGGINDIKREKVIELVKELDKDWIYS